MKINWDNIKLFFATLLVLFLYAFSSHRNNTRKVSAPKIHFVGDTHLFITQNAVSKLLIQNFSAPNNVTKESLDLNVLESSLNANAFIESAQVYLSVNGVLKAEVKQKKPIARVQSAEAYYVDNQGGYMPLSTNYSERVPFVTGFVDKKKLHTVYTVAKKIKSDVFLKTHVVQIHQNKNESIYLKFRGHKFKVNIGSLSHLDKKINNLKVFYKKALKDKILDKYKVINLQFDNQVVCTKM